MIELMVTVAVIAILATIAVPSFQRQIASTRLSNATNDLYASLMQARNDAIKSGERMTVCKSNTGTSCVTGATPTWNEGWITVVDSTRTAALPAVDTGEVITNVHQGYGPSILVQGNTNLRDYVSYGADGQPKQISGGFLTGVLRVCSTSSALTNDERARDLTVNFPGRINISKPGGIAATCPAP